MNLASTKNTDSTLQPSCTRLQWLFPWMKLRLGTLTKQPRHIGLWQLFYAFISLESHLTALLSWVVLEVWTSTKQVKQYSGTKHVLNTFNTYFCRSSFTSDAPATTPITPIISCCSKVQLQQSRNLMVILVLSKFMTPWINLKHLWGFDVQKSQWLWGCLLYGVCLCSELIDIYVGKITGLNHRCLGKLNYRQHIHHIWSAINNKSALRATDAVQRLLQVQPRDAIIACRSNAGKGTNLAKTYKRHTHTKQNKT